MKRRTNSMADLRGQRSSWWRTGVILTICLAFVSMLAQAERGYVQMRRFGAGNRLSGDAEATATRRKTQEWLIEGPLAIIPGQVSDGSENPFAATPAKLPLETQSDVEEESEMAVEESLLPIIIEESEEEPDIVSESPEADDTDPISSMPIGDLDLRYPGVCKRTTFFQLPELQTFKILRSKRARVYSDVSIVTQLSIDRLEMLRLQCSAWGSIISAAIHVPMFEGMVITDGADGLLKTSIEDTVATVEEFHADMDENSKCKLDMVMIVEEMTDLSLFGMYPVNALRNRALQLSQTEIVFLLDADFLPSKLLSADIKDPEKYATLRRVTNFKQAIVMPAFETMDDGEEGRLVALKAAESKDDVRDLFNNKKVQGFHMDHFNNGHGPTDFNRWIETSMAYRAEYQEGFEPYVLVARKYVPWYDERFKGYRKNKVVHLMHMWSMGMSYVVSPRGYVVHSPHTAARSWEVTRDTGYWKVVKRMYYSSMEQMGRDEYVPYTKFRCESRVPEKWSWYR